MFMFTRKDIECHVICKIQRNIISVSRQSDSALARSTVSATLSTWDAAYTRAAIPGCQFHTFRYYPGLENNGNIQSYVKLDFPSIHRLSASCFFIKIQWPKFVIGQNMLLLYSILSLASPLAWWCSDQATNTHINFSLIWERVGLDCLFHIITLCKY